MKQKLRKPPSMPHYFWFDADGCWWCRGAKENGCNGCKACKEFLAEHGGSHRDKRNAETFRQALQSRD